MEYSEGVFGDLVGIVVFQELLEEMFWFFCVEDVFFWNYFIFVLVVVVVIISMVFLGRSIQVSRKEKMQLLEKEILEVLYLDEVKDYNSLNNLREILFLEKLNLVQVEFELKERDVLLVFFLDVLEIESQ